MRLRDIFKIFSYTGFLYIIGLIFFFNNFMQPVGMVGTPTSFNFLASLMFLSGWIISAIVAGKKQNKKYLCAAMLYSFIPLIQWIILPWVSRVMGEILTVDTFASIFGFVGYFSFMLWSWPIQGLFWVDWLSESNYFIDYMLFLEPVVFLIGYFVIARYVFKRTN